MIASYFFWNSGTPEQRSQVGLLRYLLFEALDYHREFIPKALHEEWERKSTLATHGWLITSEVWSLARLQKAFKQVITFFGADLKLCFFIDGVDEYEGKAGYIAQFFLELSHCSEHAKFCVSSRPWACFPRCLLRVSYIEIARSNP